MPKLPRIPSKLILRALKRAHFYIYHQTGSHMQLRHPTKKHLRVTVPFKKKDINPKTLKTIITQSNLTIVQFIDLL